MLDFSRLIKKLSEENERLAQAKKLGHITGIERANGRIDILHELLLEVEHDEELFLEDYFEPESHTEYKSKTIKEY